MYVCTYIHICMYVYNYVCMYAFIVCMYVYNYVGMCIYVCYYVSNKSVLYLRFHCVQYTYIYYIWLLTLCSDFDL